MSESEMVLPHCTLQLQSDGILLCTQRSDMRQTRASTVVFLEAIQALTPEPGLLLVHMNGQHTDKEARALLASAKELRAVAMVLSSRVGTMLVNFFLRVNRPHYPMAVFTNEEDARSWLLRVV